jgi:hypothetical protein
MEEELDFCSAMSIIHNVEKSDFKGDYSFLKLALGEKTLETMATLGYIRTGGFYFKDKMVIDTYAVTDRYVQWSKHLFRRNFLNKIINFLKPKRNGKIRKIGSD